MIRSLWCLVGIAVQSWPDKCTFFLQVFKVVPMDHPRTLSGHIRKVCSLNKHPPRHYHHIRWQWQRRMVKLLTIVATAHYIPNPRQDTISESQSEREWWYEVAHQIYEVIWYDLIWGDSPADNCWVLTLSLHGSHITWPTWKYRIYSISHFFYQTYHMTNLRDTIEYLLHHPPWTQNIKYKIRSTYLISTTHYIITHITVFRNNFHDKHVTWSTWDSYCFRLHHINTHLE